jgi:DNA polymerase III alpha subunit
LKNNNNITAVFKTHCSLGRSILSIEDEDKITDDSPASIIAVAKTHNLNKLFVVEDSFLGFPKLYKYCNKNDIQLIFGINFILCNNVNDKDEKSFLSEHKISVVMKNSQGYKDLIKLHDAINGNIDNFYYISRGDFKIIQDNWSDNLELVIPPFDNFIHKNYLCNGNCLPELGKIKPKLTLANMNLPWNDILNKKLLEYAKNNNYEINEIHPVYYYRKSDFKAYCIFRAIDNRAKFPNPNINYFCSDAFSFEEYYNKIGEKI